MKKVIVVIRTCLFLAALATTALTVFPSSGSSQDTTCCWNDLGCLGGRYACGVCNGFHCTTSIR
jgi:hypothetical protein